LEKYIVPFDQVLERHKRFIGREDEIERVRRIVFDPRRLTSGHEGRGDIIVVHGPPGRGKTAFLAELVRRLSRETFCVAHFFEDGLPSTSFPRFAERSIVAQLMTRYDLPPWVSEMQLGDVLHDCRNSLTDIVVIVRDDIDLVPFGKFRDLPIQVVLIVSQIVPGGEHESQGLPVVHEIALPRPTLEEAQRYMMRRDSPAYDLTLEFGALALRLRGEDILPTFADTPLLRYELAWGGDGYERFLRALVVARGPVPLRDLSGLTNDLPQGWQEDAPSVVTRVYNSEPSVWWVSDYARDEAARILGVAPHTRQQHVLATAVAGEHQSVEETSWYGLMYGPYHYLQAGDLEIASRLVLAPALVRRRVELFGAEVAVEAAVVTAREVLGISGMAALLRERHRLERTPSETSAILYSALRRSGMADERVISLVDSSPLRVSETEPGDQLPQRWPAAILEIREFDADTLFLRLDAPELGFLRNGRMQLLAGHPDTVNTFDVWNEHAMSGSRDGTVCFWDLTDGRLESRHTAHDGPVTAVIQAPQRIYSCSADGTVAHWFHIGEWELANKFDAPDAVMVAVLVRNGILVGCRDGTVTLIAGGGAKPATRVRPFGCWHEGPVTAMARLPKRGLIVSGGHDRMLQLAVVGELPGTPIPTGHTLGISGIAVSPDESLIATWSADRTVRLWALNGRSLELVSVVAEHRAAITAVAFYHQRNKPRIVSCSANGEVRVAELRGGLTLSSTLTTSAERAVRAMHISGEAKGTVLRFGGDDRILFSWPQEGARTPRCAYQNDSNMLVVTTTAGVKLRSETPSKWELPRGVFELAASANAFVLWRRGERALRVCTQAVVVAYGADQPLTAVTVQNTGEFHAGTAQGSVWGTGFRAAVLAHDAAVSAIASASGAVISGSVDGTINYTDGGRTMRVGMHQTAVTTVVIDRPGGFAISGALDGTLLWYDLAVLRSMPIAQAHSGAVVHSAFVRGMFLTASDDGTLAIYRAGVRIATCIGHEDAITSFAFDDARDVIYTASLDSTVRAWRFDGTPAGTFYGTAPFTCVTATPTGAVAVDDTATIWTFQWGTPITPEPESRRRAATKKKVPRRSAKQK
jgi:WD40 repeat protein